MGGSPDETTTTKTPTKQTTSQVGVDLIKKYEGLRTTAYLDPVGVPTIGYGHIKTVTKADVTNKKTITAKQAEDLLREELPEYEGYVRSAVKVPLNQNQFDALVSFTYNLGNGNLNKSTLLKKLNKSDYKGAQAEFAQWNKAGGKVLAGLVTRRADEAKLFGKAV